MNESKKKEIDVDSFQRRVIKALAQGALGRASSGLSRAERARWQPHRDLARKLMEPLDEEGGP
jgi:hypothetical protein